MLSPQSATNKGNINYSNINYKPLLVSVILLFTLSACMSKLSQTAAEATEDNVKAHYVTLAHAAYNDSLQTSLDLQLAVNRFISVPNDATLNAAKLAYKKARIPYQQSEIMRWDSDIALQAITPNNKVISVDEWEGQVNAWPLDEGFIDYTADNKTAGIINNPTSYPKINKALLIEQNGNGGEANVTTGVHAIEFLLWGQDLNGTKPGAGNRPASDYNVNNCEVGNCKRRGTYLRVATELLVEDLSNMVAEWSPVAASTPGSLAYNYLNSNIALDYMLLSMRAMATDELASARMGSGLELLDVEEEHDCFSDLSHVAIYYNFQGVKNAFYGHYNALNGPSIADLIKQKNPATFATIDTAFTNIETKMKAIYDLGEQQAPVRFDQIIGEGTQAPVGKHYTLALNTSNELIELDSQFNTVQELLSLQALVTSGDGD